MKIWKPAIVATIASGVVAACGTTPTDPPIQDAPVIRPSQVQDLSLEHNTLSASSLTTSGQLAVGRAGHLTIAGGPGGLFEVTTAGLQQIDIQPVNAIVAYGTGLVVANDLGLHVYNGTLQLSPITDILGSAKVTALASRDQQLWIGTNLGLYVYDAQMLHSFDDTMNVVSLQSFTNSQDLVVQTNQGFEIYRLANDAWTRLTLSDEVSVSDLAPATRSRIIGLSSGSLLQRVEIENQKAVWRALSTSISEDDPGARNVETLVTDPTTGAVWAIEAASLTRIDPSEGSISSIARPSTIPTVQSAAVSSDGTLWIYDGSQLHELGQSGEIVTYSTIESMSASTCNRCHKTLGTAPMPLDSYEAWVSNVDKIIGRLENQTMPPSGTPLIGGTADTVRQWKALGMPQ